MQVLAAVAASIALSLPAQSNDPPPDSGTTSAVVPADTLTATESSGIAIPWQLLLSGLTGAVLTQSVTVIRERQPRREARNAIQREAVADVISAIGELVHTLGSWRLNDSAEAHEHWVDRLMALNRPTNDAFIRAQLVVVDARLTDLIDALHLIHNNTDTKLLKAARSADGTTRPKFKAAIGEVAEEISKEFDDGTNDLLEEAKSTLKLR